MAVAVGDSRAGTPWAGGRFDQRRGAPRLLFGRTFEDPAIELAAFPSSGTVLCIAGAGDTARAIASAHRRVIAVDLNPAQLHEVDRRLSGGAPREGSADRLLRTGRGALRPFGWVPRRLHDLCQLEDPDEQVRQWADLASPSVRLVLRVALQRRGLRVAYGPDFASVAPSRFGDVLLDRIGSRIAFAPNRANPWLSHLLTGNWSRPEPHDDAAQIDLRLGDVAEVLAAMPPGSLDGISLSNVLDGPSRAYADRLLRAARVAARPGAPIVLRSFLDAADAESADRADRDRSLLWGSVSVLAA